jgi:hypothetical protein
VATSRDFSWRRTTLADDIARGLDVTRCAQFISQPFWSLQSQRYAILPVRAGKPFPLWGPLVLPEFLLGALPPSPASDEAYQRHEEADKRWEANSGETQLDERV